ncbi:MAG: hypothetical protein ACLVHE_06295 [Dialister invisus]
MKRKNTEDPLFKLHRKNHQHDPDNLDFIEKALVYKRQVNALSLPAVIN